MLVQMEQVAVAVAVTRVVAMVAQVAQVVLERNTQFPQVGRQGLAAAVVVVVVQVAAVQHQALAQPEEVMGAAAVAALVQVARVPQVATAAMAHKAQSLLPTP